MMLASVAQRLRMALTRGRIVKAALNPKRALVQISGLAGETKNKLELFLPFGMSAFPTGKEDVILLQIGGSRSHLVALFADSPALRIQDLQKGEFGFRDGQGQQIVFRQDKIEITTPDGKDVELTCGGDLTATISGDATIEVDGDLTSHVEGDANLTVDGAVNMTVAGDVTASAARWMLTGFVHVDGDIAATGSIEEHQP